MSLAGLLRVVVLAALVLPACRDSAGDDEPGNQPDAGTGYPAPRDDVVPAVGTAGAVDLATWNIENFPKEVATVAFTADLVQSMQLDLIGVQEIADTDAFDELVARLPDHEAVLSSHTYGNGSYQKVGFVYRSSLITLSEPTLLFRTMGYEFPRPPLQVTVHVDDGIHPAVEFIAIVVHLKAGIDDEDRSRREAAVALLEWQVAQLVAFGEDEVVILGDYNEILTTTVGRDVMAPWLDAPAQYVLRTDSLAQAGGISFLPYETMLDHIVTTAGLEEELRGGTTTIPRIDEQTFNYERTVSDHLPVVISMPILE